MRSLFTELLARSPRPAARRRTPLTDAEVKRHIREALGRDPRQRPTAMLRQLRGGGRACEQSRFASLFREVRERAYGS